jgi:N-acetylneuraminic acid mutarotase
MKLIGGALACLATVAVSSLQSPPKEVVSLHWTKSSPFPEATSGYAAGVVQGKLVLAGGTYWEGTAHHWSKKLFSAATYSYDPANQEWERLPDVPTPLGYPASTTLNNTLFVLGGYTGHHINRDVFALTKERNKYVWKNVGDLPVDRIFSGAVSVGKDIYLVGGSTQFEPLDASGTCCTSSTATNSLLVFDTTNPSKGWCELNPYPGARRWFFTTATDGKSIWMFGGQYQANSKDPVQYFPEVLRFSPVDGKWKLVARLPSELRNTSWVSPVFADRKMILISSIGKTWQLDLNTLKYTELTSLPETAEVDKFVWLRGRVLGAGGENNDKGPRRRSESTFVGQFEAY